MCGCPEELNGGGLIWLVGGWPIGLCPCPIGLGPGTDEAAWVPTTPALCCCGFTCGGTSCASGKESAYYPQGTLIHIKLCLLASLSTNIIQEFQIKLQINNVMHIGF